MLNPGRVLEVIEVVVEIQFLAFAIVLDDVTSLDLVLVDRTSLCLDLLFNFNVLTVELVHSHQLKSVAEGKVSFCLLGVSRQNIVKLGVDVDFHVKAFVFKVAQV